jgi:hypothetical protein
MARVWGCLAVIRIETRASRPQLLCITPNSESMCESESDRVPSIVESRTSAGADAERRPVSRRRVGPGGVRPEPLTDPCLTVSGHTARATRGRPAPSAETIGFLLLPVDPCRSRLGDPPPSLHENYPGSSLLRSSPPLFGTSVLSASRGFRLGLLP